MSFNLIPFEHDDLMMGLPSLNMINNTLLMIQTIKNLPASSLTNLDDAHVCSHADEDEENSIEIQLRQEEVSFVPVVVKKKKTGCTCSKTNCLKRYCECFSAGKMCTPECACYGCHNN